MDPAALRQRLHRRDDVPDADIDDIIERAQQRQDEARRATEGRASVAEVQAVAAELDIAPEHVEAAIADLRRQREEAAAASARATQAAAAARARRTTLLRRVALGLGAASLALSVLTGGAALSGRGAVVDAQREVAAAEARLDAALSRQASLAPQLVALAGADAAELAPLQAAVRDAPDVAARLDAADALSVAMATRLGQLPPAASPAEATARLNLQDELTGSQSRVTVELRRYHEAEAAWQAAADSPTGGLAVALGLAAGP